MLQKEKNFKRLSRVGKRDSLKNGQAIIYGNFIQRLGFSSGGFPQDIRLINTDTNEIMTLRVKPTFTSAKKNTFAYFIKPGNYAILNYWWAQSTWFGGKIFTEPIYKGIDMHQYSKRKDLPGQTESIDWTQFAFAVNENSVNYLGTWNFDKGIVAFADDKAQFDHLIKNKFNKLDFSLAKTVLPD